MYYIITENGKYDAENTSIKLLDTSTNKYKSYSIDFNIEKDKGVKIPIALCDLKSNNTFDYINKKFDFSECINPYYKPISITYNNKFLFSKNTINSRELNNYIFFIDGKAVAAIGGEDIVKTDKWYLKENINNKFENMN